MELSLDRGVQLVDWKILGQDLQAKNKVRRILNSSVMKSRLESLDEAIGTIVTLTAALFALLALTFIEYQIVFGFTSIAITIFFWVGYRIAKILHAIEIRFMIISSFMTFVFWYLFFGLILSLSSLSEGVLETLLVASVSSFGLLLIALGCTKISDRIWRWLSSGELRNWSPLGTGVFGTRDESGNNSGFLIFMIVLAYGLYICIFVVSGLPYVIVTCPMFIIFFVALKSSWSKVYEIWFRSLEQLSKL